MKIYIFEDVSRLTGSYHGGGSLVVRAKDEEQAKVLIKGDKNIKLKPKDWEFVEVMELKEKSAPKMWIFPDAGCC